MLVYKDLITGDELCSDAYPQLPPFGQQDLAEGMARITQLVLKLSPVRGRRATRIMAFRTTS